MRDRRARGRKWAERSRLPPPSHLQDSDSGSGSGSASQTVDEHLLPSLVAHRS
ncbi:hypothetical protein STRTUCAR8_05450 [Streptomyces turgidiscabies Car8]|uniref:Uncharacterized protein n=1 Tax=Streptomyces turgidiscabies (strain Car8) TaxID=698760 RepID=L7FJQ1_STRT8|nr:hypothetical protein STRTUCAR8_05450 [Streptomyces turgidiscabies Car8]